MTEKPKSEASAKLLATMKAATVKYKGIIYCPTRYAAGAYTFPELTNTRCSGKTTKVVQPRG